MVYRHCPEMMDCYAFLMERRLVVISFAMQVLTFRAFRKDKIYFRTIEEREKINASKINKFFVRNETKTLVNRSLFVDAKFIHFYHLFTAGDLCPMP